jgi:hypothetical protein
MDPYLEGVLWPDVHQALAAEIRTRLAPAIRPRYVARLAIKTVHGEMTEEEVNVIYPDVEIVRRRSALADPSRLALQSAVQTLTVTPPIKLPVLGYQQRMVTVEVYLVESNELVACIEVLSPANKRGFGLRQYSQKRQRLHKARVHLLEIDLTRRGQRPITAAGNLDTRVVQQAPYLVTLWRADHRLTEAWLIAWQDRLPVVAVPLRAPDPDVPLDLADILATIYDVAAYDLSIDYMQDPPPPALDDASAAWLRQTLREHRRFG